MVGHYDHFVGESQLFFGDPQIIIGDPQLFIEIPDFRCRFLISYFFLYSPNKFIGDNRFSLRPTDFNQRPPDFYWRPQSFHWKHQILLETSRFSLETPRFTSRPQIFVWGSATKICGLNIKLVSPMIIWGLFRKSWVYNKIWKSPTKILGLLRIVWGLHIKSGVSNKNIGIPN